MMAFPSTRAQASLDRRGSSIYEGWVMHRRLSPRHHRFKYRVFAMLLQLDELAALDRRLRLFKHNRWGLFGFHDKDHGDGRDLNVWLDDLLAQQGIVAKGARRVLCYPRILGYVFNPLSVWFCDDETGALQAIVYEVHNTYEERHAYVLPVGDNAKLVRHSCAKRFYVSPFLSRDCRYNFRVRLPGKDVAVAIQEEEAGAPILNASFAGEQRVLADGVLLRMLLRYPLMTLKVVAAIHFEAVRLMLKGVRRHPHAPKALYAPE
ncbi:MAG TPA: DUF1365 domain-containing protein [Rhizomicrobium sp.]|nr:DUF1365 domain-containing protein [Rhizomicrobium sp.]